MRTILLTLALLTGAAAAQDAPYIVVADTPDGLVVTDLSDQPVGTEAAMLTVADGEWTLTMVTLDERADDDRSAWLRTQHERAVARHRAGTVRLSRHRQNVILHRERRERHRIRLDSVASWVEDADALAIRYTVSARLPAEAASPTFLRSFYRMAALDRFAMTAVGDEAVEVVAEFEFADDETWAEWLEAEDAVLSQIRSQSLTPVRTSFDARR